MALITLGTINKKILLIPAFLIFSLIYLLALYKGAGYYNMNLYYILEDVGPSVVGLIMIFIFKPKKEKTYKKKKLFLDLFILFIFKSLVTCYEILYRYFLPEREYVYDITIINTIQTIELSLMTIASIFILKYKYYIHHLISMIIFSILSVSNDLLLDNFSKPNYKYFYIYMLYLINEVLAFCYFKYMMDFLYYHYSELVFFWGIFGVISKLIIFPCLMVYEDKNEIEKGIIYGIKKYFSETNVIAIIFLQFIYFALDRAIFFLLNLLIVYYYRPNHVVIGFEIFGYIYYIVAVGIENNLALSIILFILQTIISLFYCEILEFNFWGLNKNTVKNIQLREEEEIGGRKSVQSEIELGDTYYLQNSKTRGSDDELNEPNENDNENDKNIIN